MKTDNVVALRKIHETAVIHPKARLGKDVEIGPYAVIGENVIIGDNTKIRECATVNRATGEGEETRIGSNCLIMAYTHVAHNCIVGNNVIMSNAATLAGHVVVEDRAIIGGLSGVHQFVKIGRNAMVGGASKVVQDIPPYVIVDGHPAKVSGLNSVGMSRAGIDIESRKNIKKAYRILYRSGNSLAQAIEIIEQEVESCPEVDHFLRFLRNAERGICRGRKESNE